MNRNFKVVFSKARGALMVVNEATSSVQAKGTKTVIAAAVAALSLGAGVASAASVEYASAEIGSGASLTVTVDGSNTVLTPSGVVGTKADGTTGTLTKDDTVTGAYTLSGGELIINGASFTGTVAADTATKKANGTITLNSVAKSGTVTGVTYNAIEGTFSKLDLNLNVYNAAAGGQAGNVTIGENTKDLTIKEGTLKTGTIEGSSTAANKVAGTATITGKNLAFGVAPDPVGDKGETSATNPGSAYDFDNAANVKLDVTAEETVKFNKGTITNAGTMTVTGKTGVTVEKEVSIANTGDLTFKDDAKVDFKADYTASAGRLFIESADNTISGNITADSLKFGTRITDSDTAKETNQVVITGTTSNSNTIAYGSTVDVKALTVEDATTTINGTLKAATTAVTDKTTAGLTVQDTTGTTGKKQYAAVSLGDITVGSAASGATTGASFTLTNNAENAVEASSLTVVKNTGASTFTLGAGKFSVGKLTNQGTVTLTDGEFSLTGEGSNASGATINLANSMAASLVVAEGASLQNQGDIGTANTQGKIKVSGTLTNLPKIEAVGGTPAVKAGTITAAAVEVDGVLSTALDAATYNVAETTINTAGELQTSLNARLDGVAVADQKPADALEIANTITLEGKITAAGAEVQNYIVNATGGAFTIKEADKTFNTVQVKAGAFATDDADVTLSVLDVKDAGTAKVNGGTLNVTTLKTVAEKSVTVEDGTLATSLTGLGLKYTDSGFAAADATTAGAGKVAGKSIVLGTSSLLDLDLGSVTEVTSAQLTGLTGLVSDDATSKGLIDIGATQIKEVKEHITDGKIEYSELNGIAGVTNDTIKSLTVTKVGELISGKDAIYGTIEQGDFEAASKDFTITDVSLTLTGTGNLVSYTNTTDGKKVPTLSTIKFSTPDSELVTTGEGAQIGQIGDGSDATNGSLYVKSGDLTANGSVTINSLEVESGAKLSIADDKDGKGYAVKTGTATGEATAIISGELAAANSDVTFGSTATAANNADGTYSFDNVNKVTGKLDAKTLTLAGDMLVNQGGTVEAATLSGQTVYVGNSASAGSLSVGELAAGNIYAAPTWKEDGSAAAVSLVAVKKAVADTVVEAGRSSIVSVGTNDVTAGTAAFAKTGFTLAKTDDTKKEYSINTKTVNSVVYAEGLQYAGNVYAGNYDADVSIGANSMLLIDATKVDATGEKSVFVEAVNMAANSVLYVDNVKNGDKISLTATMSGTSINADLVHEGDLLMGADEDQFKKGVLEFGMHDKADVVDKLGNVAGLDAIYGMYENGENVGNTNAQFFRDLMSSQTSSAYDSAAGEWNFQTIRTTLNDVAAIGATTGAQAVTMDAVNQMADTVAA
ncbi:beta strand repeat-containing protein, partial [Sutterella wadsworthensis]|uniref:beta strand repeat-containing protein n=1 Tax=Sutterella wadsworthensis TaxID=40545 RepID=UPI003078C7AA